MAKFSKKTVDKIVGLVKSDTFTIAEICRQVGITPKTYHLWMNDYPDFADAIEQAKEERMQSMVIEAKKSLMKKIQGYDVTETKVVTIPGKQKDEKGNPKPIIKEQTTTKKHIQPDTAALIFTLTNAMELINILFIIRICIIWLTGKIRINQMPPVNHRDRVT